MAPENNLPPPDRQYQQQLANILGGAGQISNQQFLEQLFFDHGRAKAALGLSGKPLSDQLKQDYTNLQYFLPRFQTLLTQTGAQERNQELANIEGAAPQISAIDAARRGETNQATLDLLGEQTLAELQAGTGLTDQERIDAQQGQRSAEMSRGIQGGQGSANREAVELALSGRAVQDARQKQAKDFLALQQGLSTDPFAAYLGMPTTGTAGAQLYAANPGTQPRLAGAPVTGFPGALGVGELGLGQQRQHLANRQHGLARQQYNLQLALARAQAEAEGIELNI